VGEAVEIGVAPVGEDETAVLSEHAQPLGHVAHRDAQAADLGVGRVLRVAQRLERGLQIGPRAREARAELLGRGADAQSEQHACNQDDCGKQRPLCGDQAGGEPHGDHAGAKHHADAAVVASDGAGFVACIDIGRSHAQLHAPR
jgi:hypothetical protein